MSAVAPYFEGLRRALGRAEVHRPVLVIDLERVDANIDVLLLHLPPGMAYRIVAKSLPAPRLIQHVRTRSGSDRIMTFNLPMLATIAATMPEVQQMLGKPLSATAVAELIEHAGPGACERVHWLVDTPQRLDDYCQAAQTLAVHLKLVFELDVGLRRGGFAPGETFRAALVRLHNSDRVSLSGLMGYEPHVTALPRAFGWQARALAEARTVYRAALEQVSDVFGEQATAGMICNAGGSPTYRLYRDTSTVNEIAAGSVLVKPTDFDQPLLTEHQPASFIATPVVKAVGPTRLPGFGRLDALYRALRPRAAQSCFIHGGHWLAEPVYPAGLRYNAVFGRSSNQEMLNAPRTTTLNVGDFVFLRPLQSEAVFLQFGDIAVYRGGEIDAWWPTFAVSA